MALSSPPSYPSAASSTPFEAGTASSGVSWGAIFAGAAGAAALSLILLVLGTGLGLSSVSPWAQDGVAATTFGVSTIVWVTVTSLLASGLGGYLAGRLRTKWAAVHSDEVYFRDTAHGFLAWSVATLATAALLSSAVGAIVGGGLKAGASVAGGAASAATVATASGAAAAGSQAGDAADSGGSGPMGYFVDSLFRKSAGAAPAAAAAPDTAASDAAASSATATTPPKQAPAADGGSAGASSAEVARIFANAARAGSLPADDARYVGQLVAERTGVSPQEAEKRVTDSFGRLQTKLRDAQTAAKEAADTARKGSAYASLWLFVSLLSGAFVASLAATFGGRQRDV